MASLACTKQSSYKYGPFLFLQNAIEYENEMCILTVSWLEIQRYCSDADKMCLRFG